MIASAVDMARRARFEQVLGWTRMSIDEIARVLIVPADDLRAMLRGSLEITPRVTAPLCRWLGLQSAWLWDGTGEPELPFEAVELALLSEVGDWPNGLIRDIPQSDRERIVMRALVPRPRYQDTERVHLYTGLAKLFPPGNDIRAALGQLSFLLSTAIAQEEELCSNLLMGLQARNR